MIYLDHNATTPIAPEVREAMIPYLTEQWGNPSSSYQFGSKLKTVIQSAREQVAELIGANPVEIVFTSGGTESDNTAIHAAAHADPRKRHIITSAVEHSAVLSFCRSLERGGFSVTYLPVDREGLFSLVDLENALTSETAAVSLMWANNETGVLFPVAEIGELCRSRNVLFHCDAVQAVGRMVVDVRKLPVDYLAVTGHKFGAPKGVGALYVRRKAPFTPFIHGGHQEQERRGGTESVPLIAGLGAAATIARKKLPKYDGALRPLRESLESSILESVRGAELNGHPTQRLVNTANIWFPGIESAALLLLLDQAGVCASSGSACLSDSPNPSHVIAAMKSGAPANESIRFSLGTETTEDEIARASELVAECVRSLQALSQVPMEE
jgi:cysteine desulfurase